MTRQSLWIAGEEHRSGTGLPVTDPYTGRPVAEVATCGEAEVLRAVEAACAYRCRLSRFERGELLGRAEFMLRERREEFARLITSESGLCVRETRYEVGRAIDVLRFAAIEALQDDGATYACDISEHGRARRVVTSREPVLCVAAITPFNHPLNTVAHKVAPAIAVGAPVVLKPSEKTPLAALRFAELLYDCGLPGPMLSVVLGPTDIVAEPLVKSPRVECLTFTGSTAVGLRIAGMAGYKRLALELGGNSELLVLADADPEHAARLACEGAFRNSGQRCTAAKRLLVDRSLCDEFARRVAAIAAEYTCGDPNDDLTRVGTVIDRAAAERLEGLIADATRRGATLLRGGRREGALANDTPYGLSTGVLTNNLAWATRVAREVRTGNVNVNELPGYRTERQPFGGVKLSGTGVKEGVVEACRWMTNMKTISWPS